MFHYYINQDISALSLQLITEQVTIVINHIHHYQHKQSLFTYSTETWRLKLRFRT